MSSGVNISSEPESHKIAVFQNKEIRRVFADGEWFFSVTDVVAVLTDSPNPGAYWRKLKQRLTAEGSQVVTICHGLKLPAPANTVYPISKGKANIVRIVDDFCCNRVEFDPFPSEKRLRGRQKNLICRFDGEACRAKPLQQFHFLANAVAEGTILQ